MEQEFRFKGTPAQFVAFISLVESRYFGRLSLFGDHDRGVDASAHIAGSNFSTPGRPSFGSITAQVLPGNENSLLLVQAKDEEWPALAPAWEIIRSELQRQGWIDAQMAAIPGKEKAPRDRDALDDELDWYEQEHAARRRVTLQQVADRSGFSLSLARKRNAARKREPK